MTRKACLRRLSGLLVFALAAGSTVPATSPDQSVPGFTFSSEGWTPLGTWKTWGFVTPGEWAPGRILTLTCALEVAESHVDQVAAAYGISAEGFVLLVTAERTFDADGRFRQANDERMSTLLTPSGLPIEGGIQGACTNRFGYDFRTPVDRLLKVPLAQAEKTGGARRARFNDAVVLPPDLPPGLYRLRLDFGFYARNRYVSLNLDAFAQRPFFQGRPWESHYYTPIIPADGTHVSGQAVDAGLIRPRVPWVILGDYISNGYRGVVAEEDKPYFALSDRPIIHDDVILPLVNDGGSRLSYSLEPQFPADIIEARSNIPWNPAQGELEVVITEPDGATSAPIRSAYLGLKGSWPSTGNPRITAWKPSGYGLYTVRVTGWIADIRGRRYEGGGTYKFWIAKRMTLATATFQGQPYPVGSRYGRDIAFNPAVPADVRVDAALYPDSESEAVQTLSYEGKASTGGVFGSLQGAKPFVLGVPGEYFAHILATYTDADGHLWVSSMRHAGVVYPADSTVAARGKKLFAGGAFVDRGETHFEGYTDDAGEYHLAHITFPFRSGDVIQIASEGESSNKIEPVLTYEDLEHPFPYEPARLAGVGTTNLKIRTSNGLSPHLFPEYISEWNYYYGSAPRPGFMSRFIIGESTVRAPYWALSPNNFGGQINASYNGDLVGDIYRLLGGVVVGRGAGAPRYAGYVSSAFILPKGTNNNRVTAAGAEDVRGPVGAPARFFLVGLRPGMVFNVGNTFGAAVQIDPILPAVIRYTVQYPDGRTVEASGPGDAFGSFAGSVRWPLDVPGLYRYWITGTWNGFEGTMPGLPADGGHFYVLEAERPAGAEGLRLNLPAQSAFDPSKPLILSGQTTAASVSYAALIPGCVLEQGTLVPTGGRFEYRFDPVEINRRFPTYDIVNSSTGKPEIGRVVHLTFFSREADAQGRPYHSFAKVLLRGSRIFYTR